MVSGWRYHCHDHGFSCFIHNVYGNLHLIRLFNYCNTPDHGEPCSDGFCEHACRYLRGYLNYAHGNTFSGRRNLLLVSGRCHHTIDQRFSCFFNHLHCHLYINRLLGNRNQHGNG